MKKWIPLVLAAPIGLGLFLAGCGSAVVVEDNRPVETHHHHHDERYEDEGEGECVRNEAPPELRIEVIPARPSPRHVWIPGRWIWRNEWIWVPGHWVLAPRQEATWEPAHWQHEPRGWVYVPGRWR